MTDTEQFVERRVASIAEAGWHLDKKIPIGLIMALLMQAAMALWAFADVKKDVELLKADNLVLHQRDTQQSSEMRDAIRLLQDQFQRMDSKLDRLIERGTK